MRERAHAGLRPGVELSPAVGLPAVSSSGGVLSSVLVEHEPIPVEPRQGWARAAVAVSQASLLGSCVCNYAPTMPTLERRQVGQAGEHFVAAELHRRGGNAVTFSGNMPKIDILASDVGQTRTVAIQVKTKTAGSWHTSTTLGASRGEDSADDRFWVLVDIGRDPGRPPSYFIMPEWWVQNHIHDRHAEYLAQHGGRRPGNPASTHWAIRPRDVEQWRDRWDVLGIF